MDKTKLIGKLYLSFSILASLIIAVIFASQFIKDYKLYQKSLDESLTQSYEFITDDEMEASEEAGANPDFKKFLDEYRENKRNQVYENLIISLVKMLASFVIPGAFFYFFKRWFRWLTS